ncbi:MAG: 2OG-Fe(II) oxygenase [Planctomycetota bacterium]|jgi:hypothetical protein
MSVQAAIDEVIRPIDADALRDRVRSAVPFPHFAIDDFLDESFAREVGESYPTFDEAMAMGRSFAAVNERGKVQITDADHFSPPVRRLHEALAARPWLDLLSHVMDIPDLRADPKLVGGGIHQTGPRGHLDVHVDFNYIEDRDLHRRLNILVYFNPDWREEWGGNVELWDREVKVCNHSFSPVFNRCVVFATSEISFHGVTAVRCPEDRARRSFAAYYYTKEAPAGWTGEKHSTIFRARPDEQFKGKILMPAERLKRSMRSTVRRVKDAIRGR